MEANILKGYNPERLFAFFEKLTTIPRGSGNEAQVASYIEGFARGRGLFCCRDGINNVFVRKEATEKYKNEPAILLQGHTDMVCEKNSDVDFDFEKDAIDIYVDDKGFLRAKGTTLGADNGVAVAMMLTVLDGALPEHPIIECLFTTQEETGLDGAKAFDYSLVSARKMINLDSENEDVVTVGCAGGTFHRVNIEYNETDFIGTAVRVSISGLMGGHSGENINSGRANANKLLGRALLTASMATDLNIVSIEGGSKDNAIPREAMAIISVSDYEVFAHAAESVKNAIAGELSADDARFCMKWEKLAGGVKMADADSTRRIIGFLSSVQNGVLAMSTNIKGLVEFSRNLGIISTSKNKVSFIFSSRSAIESQLDLASYELQGLALLAGGDIEHLGRYPGWEYAKASPLRDKYTKLYEAQMGKLPIATVIHAGLECGIIKSNIPDMDIISIGPSMRDIHSPDEALELASFAKIWEIVCGLII